MENNKESNVKNNQVNTISRDYKGILCLIGLIVGILAVFMAKYYMNHRYDDVKDLHIEVENPSYMVIAGKGHRYTINNPDIITEIIDLINEEPIKKKGKALKPSKNGYSMSIYTEDEKIIGLSVRNAVINYKKIAYYLQNEGELERKIEEILTYSEMNENEKK